MGTSENKALTRRFFEDACNGQRFDLIDELFVEDYVHHDPNLPPEAQHGRENYKQGLEIMYAAFPDLQATIEDLIAEGDRVVSRIRMRGSHQGELFGIPATGRPVDFAMIEIHRIADGKIAEGWANYDAIAMMQQIGVIPSPEQAAP
jgi:steroid delta-isomerase-like uncharacterized protein